MVHILGLNVCSNYYLKFFDGQAKAMAMQEEDAMNDDTSESDTENTFTKSECAFLSALLLTLESPHPAISELLTANKIFHFCTFLLPLLHFDIVVPPPRF
jgi:hypothetical protein